MPVEIANERAKTGKTLGATAFQSLVEAAPDAMVVIDSGGTIILINRQFELLFGYSRDELIGQTMEILVPDSVRERHHIHRDGYFAEPKFREMGSGIELRARRKDGTEFPVEISLSPLQTEQEMLATASIRDITERKNIGERFRALLDAAPDAMVIVDSDARIALVNDQTEKLFGYKRDALIGKNVTVLMPERFRGTHGEHTERFFRHPNVRPMGQGLELFGRRKDGREFPIEISLSPIDTGQGLQAIAAIRDTSERKKASERFRALLETAPDAMVIVDQKGIINLVNQQAEKLFGYTRDEFIGKDVKELMPERFRQGHGQHTQSYFQKPNVRPMGRGLELFGVRKDGTEFPIEISLSPIETERGLNATAAIRDITDRKLAERKMQRYLEKIEQSNRDLEQFANVASHDMREPLRKIRTFCDRLQAKCGDQLNDDGQDYLRRMMDSADRMSVLMENLLEYSRLNSRSQEFEPVDIGEVVHGVLSDLETMIEERKASIEVGELPVIDADRHMMRRMFQNLIVNALKFQPPGKSPNISIGSMPSDRSENVDLVVNETFVELYVKDDGIGIAPEHRQRIFDMFQRLHSHSEYSGTGIGLAICERIIGHHNGRIRVESQPGEGATFILTLPVKQVHQGEVR